MYKKPRKKPHIKIIITVIFCDKCQVLLNLFSEYTFDVQFVLHIFFFELRATLYYLIHSTVHYELK